MTDNPTGIPPMTFADGVDSLDIRLLERPDVVRCVVSGEVTMDTRDQLVECLEALIDARHERIEIDLAAVSFMDSQGLWALMRARQHAEQTGAGATLTIIAAAPMVQRLLHMTTVDSVFGYSAPR